MNQTMRNLILLIALLDGLFLIDRPASAAAKPNVLIITVDDMSADSLGAFGCKLPDTSPNIDRLAAQGMRFNRAHVVVGNCFPSRNVMWSGLYPHNTGVEGFYQVPRRQTSAPGRLDAASGLLHRHPAQGRAFDALLALPGLGCGPGYGTGWDEARREGGENLRRRSSPGHAGSAEAGKPFCLVLNVADPHKPFYAEGNRGETIPDKNVPSRVFTPQEVPIPGFLFDDPVVRKELAHYYSSVRRADDCVGAILAALEASGQRENTIILFLSDHGMPLPFAKTQVYHHSTVTPLFWIVPGVTKAGAVDAEHMVSAVDLLPTLLELTGIEHPEPDGRPIVCALASRPEAGGPRLCDQGIQRERRRLARSDAGDPDAAVPLHLQSLVQRPADHGHGHDRHLDLSPHGRAGQDRFGPRRPARALSAPRPGGAVRHPERSRLPDTIS